MGNLAPKWEFWLHWIDFRRRKWDVDLDRMERFASTFGDSYTRKMDMGFLAFGSALCALLGLLLG